MLFYPELERMSKRVAFNITNQQIISIVNGCIEFSSCRIIAVDDLQCRCCWCCLEWHRKWHRIGFGISQHHDRAAVAAAVCGRQQQQQAGRHHRWWWCQSDVRTDNSGRKRLGTCLPLLGRICRHWFIDTNRVQVSRTARLISSAHFTRRPSPPVSLYQRSSELIEIYHGLNSFRLSVLLYQVYTFSC